MPDMPAMKYAPAAEPVAMELPADTMPADGVSVFGAVLDGRPLVVFQFRRGDGSYPPIALLRLDGLAELVAGAVDSARGHDGMPTPEPEPDPLPDIRCRGECGRRLFGERAESGICAACAPLESGGRAE